MTHKELAEKIGMHPVSFSRAINTATRMSDGNAVAAEKITKIPFSVWKTGTKDELHREVEKYIAKRNKQRRQQA